MASRNLGKRFIECSFAAVIPHEMHMKDDWWKYPDSFLKLIMNTGETKEVRREDINSEVFKSLVVMWDHVGAGDVALPFPGDYYINVAFDDPGSASFFISKGILPLSYSYFSSEYDDYECAWGCVQEHYFSLTDKSAMEWSLAERPVSKPWLAVIRYRCDLRCDCQQCKERRQREPDALEHSWAWLGEAESAMGFLLVKEGFPKELYGDEAEF